MTPTDLVARIDHLLTQPLPAIHLRNGAASELIQATVSLMGSVYGDANVRLKTFMEQLGSMARSQEAFRLPDMKIMVCQGALRNLKAELEGGLARSLQMQIASGVVSDFLQLAKHVLTENSNATNVAAVLVAAAFEDTIRRMAETLAGITERDNLEKIVNDLKKADILKQPLLGQVLAHLKFRNDALHADWANIDEVSVNTAWQLVQGLLLKHFS